MTDHLPATTGDNLPATVQENPMSILGKAVEQGMDADSVAILSKLAVEWEDRAAAKEFSAALRTFQDECPPIVKSKHGGRATKAGSPSPYSYAALDVIEKTIRPHLNRLGFSFGWDSRTENNLMTVTCTLRHINGHRESASFTCPCDSKSNAMSGQHLYAGAESFSRRYSLTAVLGITTADEDTDAMDPTAVSKDQAATLDALISQSGSDKTRFLAWAGADSIEEVLASQYESARLMLTRKIEAAR